MLDFRPRVRPRNYLARREQRRLLAWVMGVGLVFIACAALFEFRGFGRADPVVAQPAIDTRFTPGNDDSGVSGESGTVKIAPIPSPRAADSTDGAATTLDMAKLAPVRDDTPWIRDAEIDAWLHVWSVLRRAAADVADESGTNVGFVELFGQPKAFRGKLVTVRGTARQAVFLEAAENSAELRGYYRVVLWPAGGPAEPIFLYTLELPSGFPTGEDIRADIAATGFFFKRMVYPTKASGELRRAPVIMARTLTWREATTKPDTGHGRFLGLITGSMVLGVLGLMIVTYWATHTRTLAVERLPALAPRINEDEVSDVYDALDKLAQSDS
jgi:hypothetical protein